MASGLYASLWTARAAFPIMRDQSSGPRWSLLRRSTARSAVATELPTTRPRKRSAASARTLANEFGPYGIRVNVVPACGAQPCVRSVLSRRSEAHGHGARLNPMRRHGRAEEDMAHVLWPGSASDAARWSTGQSLYMSGGSAPARSAAVPQRRDFILVMSAAHISPVLWPSSWDSTRSAPALQTGSSVTARVALLSIDDERQLQQQRRRKFIANEIGIPRRTPIVSRSRCDTVATT